jgi:hypothetical protein
VQWMWTMVRDQLVDCLQSDPAVRGEPGARRAQRRAHPEPGGQAMKRAFWCWGCQRRRVSWAPRVGAAPRSGRPGSGMAM